MYLDRNSPTRIRKYKQVILNWTTWKQNGMLTRSQMPPQTETQQVIWIWQNMHIALLPTHIVVPSSLPVGPQVIINSNIHSVHMPTIMWRRFRMVMQSDIAVLVSHYGMWAITTKGPKLCNEQHKCIILIEMIVCRFIFHWNKFLNVQLSITQ